MIILRRKVFSEELKQLISQRMQNKAQGINPTVSASAQLAQMKQNTAVVNAVNDASRTARRDMGHQLQDRITAAAQKGNNSQKTRLLNKTVNAGIEAGYNTALNLHNNNNQQAVQSGAQTIQNSQPKPATKGSILGGVKSGVSNAATNIRSAWGNMSTGGKIATGTLLLGGAALAYKAHNDKKRAEEEGGKGRGGQQHPQHAVVLESLFLENVIDAQHQG